MHRETRRFPHLVPTLILASVLLTAAACQPPTTPAPPGLLLPAPDNAANLATWDLPVVAAAVLRQRYAEVNDEYFRAQGLGNGPESGRLVLNLFDDVTVTAVRQFQETQNGGVEFWTGTLEGHDDDSHATLGALNGLITAEIQVGDRHFQIHPLSQTIHAVVEVDLSQYPNEEDPADEDEPRPAGATASDLAAQTDDAGVVAAPAATPTVTVQVVYNGPNPPGMHDAIAIQAGIAVGNMNQSFKDQGIDAKYVVAHVDFVAHTSTGTLAGDLAWVKSDPTVLALRNGNDADTVAFWDTDLPAASGCGKAGYSTIPTAASADSAYTVVKSSCAVGNYSFAHEQGHLLGLNHDHFTLKTSYPPDGVRPGIPCGYGFPNPGIKRRTIMAYPNACTAAVPPVTCRRVNVWSTPAATSGQPAGSWGVTCTPVTATSASTSSVINGPATTVAAFR